MDSVEVRSNDTKLDGKTGSLEFPTRRLESTQRVPNNNLQAVPLSGHAAIDAYRSQLKSSIECVRTELGMVESQIRRELKTDDAYVSDMLAYVSDLGGKRLRPTLLLLSAKAIGTITEEAIRLGVVVELVHTATLVHDDILDNALLRRHKQTVHTRWSVPASVLVGDWLFTHAYALANHGSSTIPGRWVADAAKRVCEGEILQGHSIKHFDLTLNEYLQLLEAKTGALCAVSCSLGAWSAGADESTCHALQQFGLRLGTAFQVFDDWLDVWGNTEQAGKTLGTDLASFKPTLPSLRALELMPSEKRLATIERLNRGDAEAAASLRASMETCDASSYTKQIALKMVDEALIHLDRLPSSESVNALRNLAIAAVHRAA